MLVPTIAQGGNGAEYVGGVVLGCPWNRDEQDVVFVIAGVIIFVLGCDISCEQDDIISESADIISAIVVSRFGDLELLLHLDA